MNLLRSIELFLEERLEGFFDRKFKDKLHPVKIAKKLSSVMEDKLNVSVNRIYAPNLFTITLSTNDFNKLSDLRFTLERDLKEYVQKLICERNYHLTGNLEITFSADPQLSSGQVGINADFVESEQEQQHTMVFSIGQDKTLEVSTDHAALAALRMIEGSVEEDYPQLFYLGKRRINIGRWEGNDIPLGDLGSSRLHAYIEYQDNKHFIVDANSLNGTYINEQRVVRTPLSHGDLIRIGSTKLVYEVHD